MSGHSGGLFAPNDPITRDQMAVMFWRYAGNPTPPNLLLTYKDVNTISSYTLDALRWPVEQGIISGYSNNLLGAKDTSTRAQGAKILGEMVAYSSGRRDDPNVSPPRISYNQKGAQMQHILFIGTDFEQFCRLR